MKDLISMTNNDTSNDKTVLTHDGFINQEENLFLKKYEEDMNLEITTVVCGINGLKETCEEIISGNNPGSICIYPQKDIYKYSTLNIVYNNKLSIFSISMKSIDDTTTSCIYKAYLSNDNVDKILTITHTDTNIITIFVPYSGMIKITLNKEYFYN